MKLKHCWHKKTTVPHAGVSSPGCREGSPRSQLHRDGRGRLRAIQAFGLFWQHPSVGNQLKLGNMSGFQEMTGMKVGHGLCKFSPGVERGHSLSSHRKHGLRGTETKVFQKRLSRKRGWQGPSRDLPPVPESLRPG